MEKKEERSNNFGFATNAIHNNMREMNYSSNPVVQGIMTSTSYIHEEPGVTTGYDYSRTNNPTRHELEITLAGLENAKYGLAFASGMGAISSVMYLLENGDEIISLNNGYSRTTTFLKYFVTKWGVKLRMINMGNENELRGALNLNKTKMLFLESPTNPELKIYDLRKLTSIAKEFDPNIITVIDNTFLSPFFQKPLELGLDISIHSVTKYINGHSDVVMGGVMLNDDDLYARLKRIQATAGAIPGPFDCYLVLRGIKTLALRMQRHRKSGLVIAQFLENHPHVDELNYPELPSHPDYEIFKKQSSGMSGVISFSLKGDIAVTKKFVTSLKLFKLAVSLGGYESLVEVPATMSHGSFTREEQLASGLSDTLIRISVGLEEVEDLIEDLKAAFDSVFQ